MHTIKPFDVETFLSESQNQKLFKVLRSIVFMAGFVNNVQVYFAQNNIRQILKF